MTYKYENSVINELEELEDEYKINYKNEIDEVRKVYRKAKAFEEIKEFVNGNSVENINDDLYEAGYVQACNDILNIIQKNGMEDK